MSSRDLILNNISKFQNDATLTISTNFETTEDSISEFIKNATLAGANVIKTSNEDIKSQLSQSIIQKDDYFIYESEIGVGETFVGQSIIGSQFTCAIERETKVGESAAVVPSIKGRAYITGTHQHMLDPRDPWPVGYRLSDTWPKLH